MKSPASIILSLVGLGFIVAFFFTDPESKTDDGYSLRYFFLVMGFWFIGLQVAIASYFTLKTKRRQAQINLFKTQGRRATATIIDYRQGSIKVNNIPQIVINLRVKNIYGKEFNFTDKKYLTISEVAKLKPGLELQALTHPQKEKKVLVLWEEAGINSAF